MHDDPRPVTVMFREDGRNPGHARVSVFVGRQPGARGHSGQLVLRTDEWDELRRVLEGPQHGHPLDLSTEPLLFEFTVAGEVTP